MLQQTFSFPDWCIRMEALVQTASLCQKQVLTFEEAVIYTGRSASDLYHLTSSRAIPHSKPKGKMIYFSREELDAWMLSNPVKTAAQLDAEAATYVALKDSKSGRGRAGKYAA